MSISRNIWEEFRSTVCSVCGGAKPPNNGFCRACYHSLPKNLRTPMWRRFGDGYEAAHEAAKKWLIERRAA
jgi:ribosomal protein L40E